MYERSPILVIGATGTIGRALVAYLVDVQNPIVIHYNRNQKAAMEMLLQARNQGLYDVLAIQADLSRTDQLENLIDCAVSGSGELGGLVHCASTFEESQLSTLTKDRYDRIMDLNLWSAIECVKRAESALRRSKGSVVLVSDIWARRPLRNHLAYCVSKAGIEATARCLARDLAPGVRVNVVAPGIVTGPDSADDIVSRTPLARLCSAREIAEAIHFLLFASGMTGSVITVDGGRRLV